MPSPGGTNAAQQGDWDTSPDSSNDKDDAALLDQLRKRFSYMLKAAEKSRALGDYCMQALGPDGPWDKEERAARVEAKRPCIHLDQLNQYPNSLVNQVRQNPQGVKIQPGGNGANDKTASLREDRWRAIETQCDAAHAYLTALQCAAERGYGAVTLETEEIAWDGWDQRIKVVREPDPNAILYDPDCKESSFADMEDGFKIWRMPISDFKRRFGEDGTITDFNLDHQAAAPDWVNIDKQTVQVARYSYFEKKPRYLYLLNDGSPTGKKVFKDELPEGATAKKGVMTFADGSSQRILKEKKAVQKSVKQCITNGIQILDRADWAGQRIPIFPCIGKEKFVRTAGVTERVLESYITNAIDGQKAFDSAKTNEVEAANMVPKIIYLGYEGQFDTSTDWKNINKIPTVYAEIKPIVDSASGQVLPLPTRVPYDPPIQSMEMMAEGALRAIQSAIGSHGFLKQDDTNVKSGKAVALLKSQSDVGSYHFLDNYETMIRAVGEEGNYLLDKIEDTPRDVGLHKKDGTHEVVRINEPRADKSGTMVEHRYTPRDPQTNQPQTDASHDVVIDTGPSYQYERAEAKVFIQSLMSLPQGALILDLLVKWQNLGVYGDEIAERVTPPQFQKQDGQPEVPPQIKQQMGQLTQQNQELQQVNQQLMNERDSKDRDNASKEKIAALQAETARLVGLNSVRVAQINAAAKGAIVHEQLTSDENQMLVEQEFARQNAQLAHEQAMQAGSAAAQQTSDQSAQDHSQGLDAQSQQADQAMAQQQQAQQAPVQAPA